MKQDQRRLDVLASENDAELGFLTTGQPPNEVLVSKAPGWWALEARVWR